MNGLVARIQRFSTTNGPGLRSTVFMKGCPLTCQWCHNPEMQRAQPELLYFSKLCAFCGACARVCSNGVHTVRADGHELRREKCTLCGACAQACPCFAIEMQGERLNAHQVIDRLLRDRPFYEASGGGITLSGGEPLAQHDFTCEILHLAKKAGLHTCLDTSGWGGRAEELTGCTDLYLWDVKETDAARHVRATGVEMAPLVDSLRKVDAAGGKIALRCPIIPGLNDREAHIRGIGALASGLRGGVSIDLIPYHRLGLGKAEALGCSQVEYGALTVESKRHAQMILTRIANVPVRWL